MTTHKEAIKLALDLATMHYTDDGYAELRSKVRQLAKEALAQPEQEPVARSDAYYMIDRFLRNNMDDDVYAEYSKALDIIYTHPPVPTAQLKEPEQEPVAEVWAASNACGQYGVEVRWFGRFPEIGDKLYTTPPQRQPLTDEQKDKIYNDWCDLGTEGSYDDLMVAVEAAHGIKEST